MALSAGFAVNHRLRSRLDIIPGVLYLRRVQHGCAELMNLCGPGSTVAAALGFVGLLLTAGLLVHFYGYGRDQTARTARLLPGIQVGIGFLLGGAVANLIESVTAGSVADFIGIYGLGIFSVGDLEIGLGESVLTACLWMQSDGRPFGYEPRHAVTGWAAALAVTLLLTTLDGRRWIGLLLLVVVVGVGWAAGALLVSIGAAKRRPEHKRHSADLPSR